MSPQFQIDLGYFSSALNTDSTESACGAVRCKERLHESCAHAAAPLAQAERNETAPDGATIPLSSESGRHDGLQRLEKVLQVAVNRSADFESATRPAELR